MGLKHSHLFAQVHRARAEEHQTAAFLFHTNVKALGERLREAFGAHDQNRIAATLGFTFRRDSLWPKHARRTWTALLAVGEHQTALDILTDERFRDGSLDRWIFIARALIGLGRLDEALEAGAKASTDTPGYAKSADLLVRARRVALAEREPGGPASWAEIGPLVQDCLALGLGSRAEHWLIRAAEQGVDADDVAELLRTAMVVLAAANPRRALDILLALRRAAALFSADVHIEQTARAVVENGPGDVPPEPPWKPVEPALVKMCCGLTLAAAGRLPDAIRLLGQLAVLPLIGGETRALLARIVGREVIETTRPSFRPRSQRKIVDVFPFFDELTVLKLKLEEMAEWVDHFVILEATSTFTGKHKPLHFWENREAFAAYADKIVHVPVEFPGHVDTPWAREFYQRDAALPELVRLCGEDDLVMLTDVDEIVKRSAVEGFVGQYAGFEMPTYSYFFNLREIEEERLVRGTIWRAKYLQNIGLSSARLEYFAEGGKAVLADAGWHFSSIRAISDLPTKFQNYSHVLRGKLDANHFGDLIERIRAGREPGFVRCELDDSFPKALHGHRQDLAQFLI